MKTLYLDIFSGISGDMLIGALLDLGVDFHELERELRKLKLEGYHLHWVRRHKSQIEGVKFDVHLAHVHAHEHGEHTTHEHEHDHTHADGTSHSHSHTHEEALHSHEHGEHAHSHESSHSHEHTHSDGTTHSHPHAHGEHSHEHEHGEHSHSHEPSPAHEHSHADGTTHSHSHSHEPHAHEHDSDHDHQHGRNFSEIKSLIGESALSSWVKEKSLAVFHRIAVAEGKIHGMPPEEVHFHEVGAVDSIVDIVGGCIALELLGKPRVLAGPVVEGTGWIQCAHGRFPIPAPATLSILGARGIALTQCEEPAELVTPTGAALLAELVEAFGPMQNLVATSVGFGLGTRDNQTRPNVLRAILTDHTADIHYDWEIDTICVLETNLDDINSEVLGYFSKLALGAGALDVFHTPVQMKKNRPAVLLTILCATSDADKFSEMILRETSAFGVRRSTTERRKLQREFQTVETPFGEVTVKIGKLNGKIIQAAPEFASCKRLAAGGNVPLKEIYAAAVRGLPSQEN